MNRLYPIPRFSYSAYRLFKEKMYDEFAKYMLGEQLETSFAMERGKTIHEALEILPILKEIKVQTGIINDALYQKEWKFAIKFTDFIFVGVIDLLCNDWIIDYKTGNPNGHGEQLNMYAWAYKQYSGLEVNNIRTIKVNDLLEIEKIIKNKINIQEKKWLIAFYKMKEFCDEFLV